MSLAVHRTFRLLFVIVFIMGGAGCALFETAPIKSEEVVKRQTRQRIFIASYDDVWRAAHMALKYPIVNENQDTGIIETEYVKAQEGFLPPETAMPSSGLRYKIVMMFAKGRFNNKESVRVTIDKRVEKLRDFFSDAESVQSDGLEEKALFYRMERELLISRGLKKAAEKESPEPSF